MFKATLIVNFIKDSNYVNLSEHVVMVNIFYLLTCPFFGLTVILKAQT